MDLLSPNGVKGLRGDNRMSHEPPVPAASQSPYPLHPAPVAKSADEEPRNVERTGEAKASSLIGPKSVAVGIGSAAIVAALLFVRRR